MPSLQPALPVDGSLGEEDATRRQSILPTLRYEDAAHMSGPAAFAFGKDQSELDLVLRIDDRVLPALASDGRPAWRFDVTSNEISFAPIVHPEAGFRRSGHVPRVPAWLSNDRSHASLVRSRGFCAASLNKIEAQTTAWIVRASIMRPSTVGFTLPP